ncbi:DNA translocase FtsK [Acetobacter sp. DsW_059]|uniref:FtsK/SpoIIIE family DNA translocase n=1 Tax=Acetobacter sp. DsW_059 TaxID=1670661 RepID=UPI0018E90B25|nr:DNA translocase FtsK [Acetobacter sp. DsW_059]
MVRVSPPHSSDYAVSPYKSPLRMRLEEAGGIVLCLLACALLIALVSYNPDDPSLNTATGQAPTNLLGLPGAIFSDTLLQSVGLAAILPAFILMAWGWRFMSHRLIGYETLPVFGFRVAAFLCLLPVGGALFSSIPLLFTALPTPAWPARAGIGGGIGLSIAQASLSAGTAAIGPAGGMVIWLLGLLLAGLLLALATGLRRQEWMALWRGFVMVSRVPGKLATRFVRYYASRKHQSDITAHGTHDEYVRDEAQPFQKSSHVSHELFEDEFYDDELTETHSEEPPPGTPHHHHEQEPETHQAESFRPAEPPPPAVQPAPAPAPVRPQVADTAQNKSGLLGRLFAGKEGTGSQGAALAPNRKGGWELPPLNLIKPAPPKGQLGPSQEMLTANARLLEQVLADYGVQGTIVGMSAGPVVTLYELEPAAGIRSARVIGLADDVARSLSVLSVRIATVPGRNVIGIEVPNQKRETVYLSELLTQPGWQKDPAHLSLALGKDIAGDPVFSDLARMPHLLVAGTTGSGKSVGINTMILSLLYRMSPDECRMIMIDPKVLELSIYDGIPHLLTPVVTEPAKAVNALKWVVREMDRRYRTMAHMQVRNIAGYNERAAAARADGEIVVRRVQTGFDPETGTPVFEEQSMTLDAMPYIVVIIDEMADLMMTAGKEIDVCVQRLAQKARAAGIHVIMATQRPSVDVITGTIKANFPTRISFQVISKFDSRTILGEQGAEQLLGQGDMLFMQGGGRITRVHGPFVADSEVEQVVNFLKEQGEPVYDDDVLTEAAEETTTGSSGRSGGNSDGGESDLYDEAVSIVTREGKASTSFVQRHLSIGYNRAAKLIEQMEREKIISPADHVGRRKVLIGAHRDE